MPAPVNNARCASPTHFFRIPPRIVSACHRNTADEYHPSPLPFKAIGSDNANGTIMLLASSKPVAHYMYAKGITPEEAVCYAATSGYFSCRSEQAERKSWGALRQIGHTLPQDFLFVYSHLPSTAHALIKHHALLWCHFHPRIARREVRLTNIGYDFNQIDWGRSLRLSRSPSPQVQHETLSRGNSCCARGNFTAHSGAIGRILPRHNIV